MRPVRRLLLAGALLFALSPIPAQDSAVVRAVPADSTEQLRLFLDCASSGCDFDYLRTELTWVNYVRDRTVAQVHVISTSLRTGSGGQEVTLKLIGLKEFEGVDDEVRYTTEQWASRDEQRGELTRILKLGLSRYLLRTRFARNLTLGYEQSAGAGPVRQVRDPWNFWVFNVRAEGKHNGESQSTSSNWKGEFSAQRVTEEWKFGVGVSGSTNTSSYTLSDSSTYKANSHGSSGNGFVVRSLGPHLSTGITFSAYSSTQQNVKANLHVAQTIEYDFFKYAEYTRRRLVAAYSLGVSRSTYRELTVFDKLEETLVSQGISVTYAARAEWGNANVGVSASNYLADFRKNRMSIGGSLSVRIVKGLHLGYEASYTRVRDQLSLAKGDATDEEVLLRLRQQRTSYRAKSSLSLSYTFGSVFNNVVNPRLSRDDR